MLLPNFAKLLQESFDGSHWLRNDLSYMMLHKRLMVAV